MQQILATLILFFTLITVNGQSQLTIAENLNTGFEPEEEIIFKTALDSLFLQINSSTIKSGSLDKNNIELSLSVLNGLKGIENNEQEKNSNFYKKQLINIYPVSQNNFLFTIAYIGNKNGEPILKAIVNLMAIKNNKQFLFSIPLAYYTKNWQTKIVGTVTYIFPDKLNTERAKLFDQKNKHIAQKFNLKPEQLTFYMSPNYQEVLKLLGYAYDADSKGKYRDGYGVEGNTIFSVMNNEDFSHDIVHYYAAKLRANKLNGAAEEGLAYSWGNAYYTDKNGEMITHKQLVKHLRAYLKERPGVSLIDLFVKKPKLFNDLAKEVSVKSVLAGLIVDEIEKRHGIAGIKALINCGEGDDNFFKVTEQLIQINGANFDQKVMDLIHQQ